MLTLGPFTFVEPSLLSAIAILPTLWLLLRLTPPAPKPHAFPPIRLLRDLAGANQTSAKAPLWLIILRLGLATIIILALAHPLYQFRAAASGSGPLVLILDDGWTSAARWSARRQTLLDMIDQAEVSKRPILLLTTAPQNAGTGTSATASRTTGFVSPAEARQVAQTLSPKPWSVKRENLAAAFRALDLRRAEIFWLSDGLDHGGALDFIRQLRQFGALTVYSDTAGNLPLAVLPLKVQDGRLVATVLRPDPSRTFGGLPGGEARETSIHLRAIGEHGRVLARVEIIFAPGQTRRSAVIDLPLSLRNELTRVEIEGEQSAGATVLADERWRRRPVGLVFNAADENPEPLLSAAHYLETALHPFSDIRSGTVADILEGGIESGAAVLVLSDFGRLVGPERDRIDSWVMDGGVLLRFAGPRMAALPSRDTDDALFPVRLRTGGRALGGALSWSIPAKLAPFDETSPFLGLSAPPEVTVSRQVLAEPGLHLAERTWARLEDGTPLVTAARRGKGWVVLFHTTAGPSWSTLSFSGLFGQMLQRIVDLSQGLGGDHSDQLLPPLATLDGFGVLGPPPAQALPLNARDFSASADHRPRAGPRHPPGIYGTGGLRHALNVTAGLDSLSPLPPIPAGVNQLPYQEREATDLKPWLLVIAVVLGLLDTLASLALRGMIPWPTGPGRKTGRKTGRKAGSKAAATMAVLMVALAALLALPAPVGAAQAQSDATRDAFALAATLDTRLAYVVTGDSAVDRISRAGLRGLTLVLARRTSVEAAEPLGVDPERDELAFFPLIYWPMTPRQPSLSPEALSRVDQYMRNGGTILFDTRDQRKVGPALDRESGAATLQRLMSKLDLPALEPISPDHVLGRTFYLIQTFPGRWIGGDLWIEAGTGGNERKVASILVGANDYASAWAVDAQNRPLAALVPGGPRQRELAFRFGVNLVMYALTGNYKDDQVHLPALLERLGN